MILRSDFEKCSSFENFIGSDLDHDYKINLKTDSRQITANDTFLAITGEKFNAVNFCESVIENGARIIIYTASEYNDGVISRISDKALFIRTKDSIQFLQEITRILAERFQERGGKLIAISGSNGKTTTKEMLYHVLRSENSEVICTQKNNNNHIGVPLTLLQINDKTKYAIIELGSNHPGEIKVLCDICQARIGVTTNIGKTHLEFFDTEENVFKEEGYLYYSVKENKNSNKYFFKNNDDSYLKTLKNEKFVQSFGFDGENIHFYIDKETAIIKNNMHDYKFTNKFITGKHNFYNLCVAFSLAQKINPNGTEKYLKACEDFKPTKNRSEWLKFKGVDIFLDAYNANPDSMKASVEGFINSVPKEESLLILGDMNELGDNSAEYHRELGAFMSSQDIQNVVFIGRFSESYNAGCGNIGTAVKSVEEFKENFQNNLIQKFKYCFIKGSRSLQLESLVDIT